MGYDVCVNFKSPALRDEMESFLKENKDLLVEMKKLEVWGVPHDEVPQKAIQLGYAPDSAKETGLGFHGSGIPRYIWNVCAWMSVKAECKDKKGFYFYYDSEKMRVTMDLENKRDTLVDEQGIRVSVKNPWSVHQAFKNLLLKEDQNKKKQVEVLKLLNERWDQKMQMQKNMETLDPEVKARKMKLK